MYNCNGFDKVTHKRLLSKLNYYGIEYNTLKWIEGSPRFLCRPTTLYIIARAVERQSAIYTENS
jgi:hypothetical protein